VPVDELSGAGRQTGRAVAVRKNGVITVASQAVTVGVGDERGLAEQNPGCRAKETGRI